MIITQEVIKKYSDEITYKKGKRYYDRNLITDMSVENISECGLNSPITVIESSVKSEHNFREYEVSVVLEHKTGNIKFYCTCPAFKQYGNQTHVCKHITSVMLKYAKEYQRRKPVESKSTIERLIEGINKFNSIENDLKSEINLYVKLFCNQDGTLNSYIELKIGINKMYIVKNVGGFLDAYDAYESYEFGKGYIFDPRTQTFNDTDRKIIDVLSDINEVRSRVEDSYSLNFGNKSIISGKRISLTKSQLMRFLNAAKDRQIDLNISGYEYENVRILQKDLPLEFKLSMENENISLLEESFPVPITPSGSAFFFRDDIYIPSKGQILKYMPFFSMFQKTGLNKIEFDKKDAQNIVSYVVPSIKKISSSFSLSPELEDKFSELPLKVKVYLDKVNNDVTCDVIYSYGDLNVSPFTMDSIRSEDKIIIRDTQKENEVQNMLLSFGFEVEKDRYIMKNEESIIYFVKDRIKKLEKLGEVYYSQAFKNMKIYGKAGIKAGVRLNNDNLLEFSFSFDGVIDRQELKYIFEAIKEKKKYYRLKDGDIIDIQDDAFSKIARFLNYLGVKEKDLSQDKILFSKYNAAYVDQKIEDDNMDFIKRNDKFKELAQDIKNVHEVKYNIPKSLENTMRDYQKTGLKWFKTLAEYGFGGILADEMGLGKTLEAISFMLSEDSKEPFLVVCPTSLVYNWKSEIEKFAPELKAILITGDVSSREEILKKVPFYNVAITSYPLLRRDIEKYADIKFSYCIIDEAQNIKNPDSQNAHTVKKIKAKGYFALTGTPIENSLTELWSIFDFIMPGYLFTKKKFSEMYELPIIKHNNREALDELERHIKPFILRRLKSNVVKELPKKIEQKLIVNMSTEQKKIYLAYLNKAKYELKREIKDIGFNKSKMKILAVLTRLRQICCDPSVFIENFNGKSGKIEALSSLLNGAVGEGHRILVFSQFTSVLKNIKTVIDKSNIRNLYLDGSTKSSVRMDMVNEFNNGDIPVFLISLKAGGTGLNLSRADIVIHFDPWWNPAVEEQASDRAHRIGQKNTVEVIKLIAQGTIEEKIFKLQEKKKQMIKNILGGNMDESNIISNMTQEEIENLFESNA